MVSTSNFVTECRYYMNLGSDRKCTCIQSLIKLHSNRPYIGGFREADPQTRDIPTLEGVGDALPKCMCWV